MKIHIFGYEPFAFDTQVLHKISRKQQMKNQAQKGQLTIYDTRSLI